MKKLIFMILTALSVLMVPMYVVADTYPSKTTTDKTVSQEKLQPENDTQKRETGQPEEKKQELDEIEKARQALQYGLESEILEVINKVDKRDFETLQGDFNRLFMETKSPAVREGLFGLYQKYNNTQLTDAAVAVLEMNMENTPVMRRKPKSTFSLFCPKGFISVRAARTSRPLLVAAIANTKPPKNKMIVGSAKHAMTPTWSSIVPY